MLILIAVQQIIKLPTANYIGINLETQDFTFTTYTRHSDYTNNGENGEVYKKPAAAKPSN